MRNEAIDWSSTKVAFLFVSFSQSVHNTRAVFHLPTVFLLHYVCVFSSLSGKNKCFVHNPHIRNRHGGNFWMWKKKSRHPFLLLAWTQWRLNFSLPNWSIPWTSQLKFTAFVCFNATINVRYDLCNSNKNELSSTDWNVSSKLSPSRETKLVISTGFFSSSQHEK